MKTLLTTAVLSAIGLTAGPALANQYGDVATVISTTPVYQRVSAPRQECWAEEVAAYDERRVVRPGREEYYSEPRSGIGAGTVLGAIVGGAIGHQFGNSSGGRDHGTAAGAIIGGLIGHDTERNSGSGYRRVSGDVVEVDRVPVTRDVQRCRTVSDYSEEVAAYDVRYSYQGRVYVTRMSYNPGPTLPVNVEVRPLSQQPVPSYRRY
jgi:uncharacterized protein YcfJ